MLRLIEDLLDFASMEVGKLAINRQLHEPGELITETLAAFDSVASKRQLMIGAQIGGDLPSIWCDRDRLLQVLTNLVSNATKISKPGGRIILRAMPGIGECRFEVSDDGPGIHPDEVKHLFERYWRSGEARYKGTGLGLSIARGLVHAHEGRIWVESELGHGTTFFFTVPYATPIASHSQPAAHAHP